MTTNENIRTAMINRLTRVRMLEVVSRYGEGVEPMNVDYDTLNSIIDRVRQARVDMTEVIDAFSDYVENGRKYGFDHIETWETAISEMRNVITEGF